MSDSEKLNMAIPVADKSLAYEVKVNYLTIKMDNLEKDVGRLLSLREA